MAVMRVSLASLIFTAVDAKKILVAGDSWGTEGAKSFRKVMHEHSPDTEIHNIAIAGTTSTNWMNWPMFGRLKKQAETADYLWLTLGGNDALAIIPGCTGDKSKTAQQCGDEFMDTIVPRFETIIEAVREANPNIKVVGFGYDMMGMDKLPICPFTARQVFPECTHEPEGGSGSDYISCWNHQFTRIHTDGWEKLAQKYEYVETVNLLGSLQAADGDAEAAIGKPNYSKWSPKHLMQWNCIHATDEGFEIIFENWWNLYWSKELRGAVTV